MNIFQLICKAISLPAFLFHVYFDLKLSLKYSPLCSTECYKIHITPLEYARSFQNSFETIHSNIVLCGCAVYKNTNLLEMYISSEVVQNMYILSIDLLWLCKMSCNMFVTTHII